MITRREACLGLTSSLLFDASAASTRIDSADLGALAQTLPSRDSARVVGAAYLADNPHERDHDFLMRALTADSRIANALHRRPRDSRLIARVIAEAVRADFIDRRVVKLDGWVLSRTEVRLCALCSLG